MWWGPPKVDLPADLLHKLRGLLDGELNGVQLVDNPAHLLRLRSSQGGRGDADSATGEESQVNDGGIQCAGSTHLALQGGGCLGAHFDGLLDHLVNPDPSR